MPVWSPDSRHFAFFAKNDDGRFVAVVDGEPSEAWDMTLPGSFRFSPDSSRFAYAVMDGEFGRVVVDGEAGPRYRNVNGFTFGPDGRHFAYVAFFEYSMSIIVDGVEVAAAMAFVRDTLRFESPTQLRVMRLDGDHGEQVVDLQIDLIGLPEARTTATGLSATKSGGGNPRPSP